MCRRWGGTCSSEAQKSSESRGELGCIGMRQTPSYVECDLDQWPLKKREEGIKLFLVPQPRGQERDLHGNPLTIGNLPGAALHPFPPPLHCLPRALFCRVNADFQLREPGDDFPSLPANLLLLLKLVKSFRAKPPWPEFLLEPAEQL